MKRIISLCISISIAIITTIFSTILFIALCFKSIEILFGLLITLALQVELVIVLMVYSKIKKIKYGDVN